MPINPDQSVDKVICSSVTNQISVQHPKMYKMPRCATVEGVFRVNVTAVEVAVYTTKC